MMDLVILEGIGVGRRCRMDRPIVVGRDKICDFVLREPRVSRQHFTLRPDGSDILLEDVSSNGTRVNGRTVDKHPLKPGDVISIGTAIKFIIEESVEKQSESTSGIETISLKIPPPRPRLNLEELEKHVDVVMGYLQALQLVREAPDLVTALTAAAEDRLNVDRLTLVVGHGEGFRRYDRARTELEKKWARTPLSTTVLDQAWEQGEGVLARLGLGELADSVSADLAEISSVIVIPLLDADGLTLGALYADRLGESPHLSADDLRVLAELALPLGRALETCLLFARLRTGEEDATLTGNSEAVTRLRDTLQRVSGVDSPIMLSGETGTGKQLVARLIHSKSSRALGPFVVVDASSLSESLAGSELFGHIKGSFTGADADREGAFARANGGTLLLHHVEELTSELQTMLLRTLETGMIRPVGADQEIQVDIRLLSTATTDMEAQVKMGEFRRDLLYRLRVIELPVPDLETRRADIPDLSLALISEICDRQGRARPRLDSGFLEALAARQWPGNVRELRNTLERLMVLGEDDTLKLIEDDEAEGSLLLEDIIHRHIRHILELAGGNKSKAADMLGIDRSTLYARLKQMGN